MDLGGDPFTVVFIENGQLLNKTSIGLCSEERVSVYLL